MKGAGDFFEPLAPPPPPSEPPRPKPWEQPDDIVGREVPLEVVIARSQTIAIIINRLTAYPNGFAFNLSLRAKPGHEMASDGFHGWRRRGASVPSDEILRFGIQFADGSKVTNLQVFAYGAPGPPTPPILLGGGGGGSSNRSDFFFWVWPLPPPGPLLFVTEWPIEGIQLSRYEISSDAIRQAAEAAGHELL